MSDLISIRQAVQTRANAMIEAHGEWPCRRGCDDCCRHLASTPLVSRIEWMEIRDALEALPLEAATAARKRIQESALGTRPFTCPLLDRESGACLVYAVRPTECRTYGFYVERDRVLGCGRIEALANASPDVIWGNHETLEAELHGLGPAAPLHRWLETRK